MSTPRPEMEPLEINSLASLEERIHRAVELVKSLRGERDAQIEPLLLEDALGGQR